MREREERPPTDTLDDMRTKKPGPTKKDVGMDELLASLDTYPLHSPEGNAAIEAYITAAEAPVLAAVSVMQAIAVKVAAAGGPGSGADACDGAEEGVGETVPKRTTVPPAVVLTARFTAAAAMISVLLPPGPLAPDLLPPFTSLLSSLNIGLASRVIEALCAPTNRVLTSGLETCIAPLCAAALASHSYAPVANIVVCARIPHLVHVELLLNALAAKNTIGPLTKLIKGACMCWGR